MTPINHLVPPHSYQKNFITLTLEQQALRETVNQVTLPYFAICPFKTMHLERWMTRIFDEQPHLLPYNPLLLRWKSPPHLEKFFRVQDPFTKMNSFLSIALWLLRIFHQHPFLRLMPAPGFSKAVWTPVIVFHTHSNIQKRSYKKEAQMLLTFAHIPLYTSKSYTSQAKRNIFPNWVHISMSAMSTMP